MPSRWRFESLAPALFFARTSISDAGWSSLVARRAHNPKVAGSNPAPAIAADQGVGLARALQSGRPGPRRPSVRAAFVVGGFVPISYQFSVEIRICRRRPLLERVHWGLQARPSTQWGCARRLIGSS